MRFRLVLALLCLPLLTAALPARAAHQARMWEVVRAPGWEVMVRSVERRSEALPPGRRYAVLVVDLTNRSAHPQTPRAGDFALWAAGGTRSLNLANSVAIPDVAVSSDVTPFGAEIAPGTSVRTLLVFDIEAHAGRLTLDYLPSGASIRIDECKCNLPSPVRTVSG